MTKPHNQRKTNGPRPAPTTFEPFVLPPHGFETFDLGRYREAGPEPQFEITYEPDVPQAVVCTPLKLGDGTIYILSYKFQSFCERAVRVTVVRRA